MSREAKKPKQKKVAQVAQVAQVAVVAAEGTAKPAEPAKAESAKEEAKEKKKESKTHIHKYVTEVSKRCTLPTELVDKLHKCNSKGEAKSLVKAYLQGNSI